MHAVSRDTTTFPEPCVYMQLAAHSKIQMSVTHSGTMDLGGENGMDGSPRNATAADSGSQLVARVDGDMRAEGMSNADNGDHYTEDEPQELRIVPLDVASDSMDTALDQLFQALSDGAALNPDPLDSESDNDDYANDMNGDDTDAALFDSNITPLDATPAQQAMLDKYDAMLGDSFDHAMENLGVGNDDGRFDDPL